MGAWGLGLVTFRPSGYWVIHGALKLCYEMLIKLSPSSTAFEFFYSYLHFPRSVVWASCMKADKRKGHLL